MPFTFSHPAFILPFVKLNSNRVSASGLIMGSMAPDFEYFIHMQMYREHGHTMAGAFYFNLPLTLVCCILFHRFVRDELIQNLPKMVRNKFLPFVGMNWLLWLRMNWVTFFYCSLFGIFSHYFIDAFTHSNGYFVQFIPYLQGETDFLGRTLPTTDFWQMMTTILGALAIGLALIVPKDFEFNFSEFLKRFYYFGVVGLIMCVILLLRGVSNQGDFIATSISGGLIGLMLAPWVVKKLGVK